jgi:hypothetical protein
MMTTTETDLLISEWGADPKPPILRDPWNRRNNSTGEERAVKAALRNRPDLGWALAERLAVSRRPCALIKHREYRWIRAARNLHTGGVIATKHLRHTEVVEQARGLHESDEIRPVLNALLMTRDATAQSVAEALNIKPVAVVEAYGDLFFSVLGRKDDLAYLGKILGRGKTDFLFIDSSTLPTAEENLLAAGFTGTIDDVLRLAGFATDSDDLTEEALTSRLTRRLLKTAADYLDSPDALKKAPPTIVTHALDMVKKSKVEQTPAFDPGGLGEFVGTAREILAKNKKIVEASIEHTTHQEALLP